MYTRLTCMCLCGMLLFAGSPSAQTPAAPGTGSPSATPSKDGAKPPSPRPRPSGKTLRGGSTTAKGKVGEKTGDTPPPPPPPPPKPKGGDAVTLVDGTVIDGVQIVKESPKEMVLQIISGVELTIPRSQVKSVKRDNISALDAKRGVPPSTPEEASGLLPGMKFSGQLSADISKPPANFQDEDLEVVLTEMCKRAGVEVVLDKSVEEIPAAERRWTYQLDANTPMTLFNLLKDDLPRKFPTLEAVYLEDKIVVATKKAVEALKTQGAIEIPGPDASPKTEAEAPRAPDAPPPTGTAATPPPPPAPVPPPPAAPKS